MAVVADLTFSNMHSHENDFYNDQNQGPFASDLYGINGSADFPTDPYTYPRTMDDSFTTATGFGAGNAFAEAPHYYISGTNSPGHYNLDSPEELRAPTSTLSTTSGHSVASASSSIIGSPYSSHNNAVPLPEWSNQGLGLGPSIVQYDSLGNEYNVSSGMDPDFVLADSFTKPGFVDPSLIHSYRGTVPIGTGHGDIPAYQPTSAYAPPGSPSPSNLSAPDAHGPRQGSQSPYLGNPYAAFPSYTGRGVSPSNKSYGSPSSVFSDDSAEKGRCSIPECGKVFKDLKAHMLTHQNERPEKCPIATCDYHIKGFARKYDKNRHTLTHYKGTMVCGFCPGSGSAAEKSFNRADVFKRHLTSVHAVEQSPPNSRKKAPSSAPLHSGKKLAGYAPDATGKCSTCSSTFSNAQDFYEHLDDCVLRIVQQEDPSEAINARRLREVENDPAVRETLRNHALPTSTSQSFDSQDELEEEDYEVDDAEDADYTLRPSPTSRNARSRSTLNRPNPNRPSATTLNNGIQKSRGLTHSKGGVTLHTKAGRKKRKDYPNSWGCAPSQMRMKKRVMCVFDGPRRLWKDDCFLDSDYEVRLQLPHLDEGARGNEYITDLDVQTLRRTEALHNATEEEKGPWVADDLSPEDLRRIKNEQHMS